MIDLLEHLHVRHEASRPASASPTGFVAFRDWSDAELQAIAALGQREDVAPGADLLAADAEDDRALFIVLSGRLEAYRSAGAGDRTIIEMQPGDLIGEMAFIDGRPRSASVRALERSSVLRIRPADVDGLCRTNPSLGVKFMREIACILSDRVRRTMAAL